MEIKTLKVDLKSWTLVEHQPWMKVLAVTWVFQLKQFPNGLAKKFKACFCICSNMQVQGIDSFETWSPVFCWRTVRFLMVLSTKLGLCSAQADITVTFLHAHLKPGEDLNIHQLPGFHCPGDFPSVFFVYLSERLQKQGFRQSNFDPCLFIDQKVIVITYVNYLLLYAFNDSDIDDLIARLKADDIWIFWVGTSESFLGVLVEYTYGSTSTNRTITLTQEGLAKWIVESHGSCTSYSTKLDTPAETSTLPKDIGGKPALVPFNYATMVGMLLYLASHSCPDIAFAVY
ncbi:hypothetical protein ACHAW6_014494 [Cyclotella cf. meneghiniana]